MMGNYHVRFGRGESPEITTKGYLSSSTILRVILQAYQKTVGGRVLLAAPTGRAGRRMAESCGMEAKTLHDALGLIADEENDYANASYMLDYDFVIVDESSMVDSRIAKELFTRLKTGCRLLLVGDADQLPPVGPGCVFRDLIDSGAIPVTRLDTVYRQAEGSRIALNAKLINEGGTDLLYGPDFEFVPASNPAQAAKVIFERLFLSGIKRKSPGRAWRMCRSCRLSEKTGRPA